MELEQAIASASRPDDLAIQRVLVVDDSRLQRRILCSLLKRWGYKVFEAESGQAALEICKKNPPDLVLSDWMMPGMDGLEFCRRFRKMTRQSYGYFILLTSKNEKNDVALGLDSGADDFLTKPVSSPELKARISAGERILEMERALMRNNALLNSALSEIQTLYDSLDNDLLEAKKLQQSLVPKRHLKFGNSQVSLMLKSSGHVGGDLVGFYPIYTDKIGLYSIDVSGHGISSALMTARLAGYLSQVPEQNVALKRRADGTFSHLSPADVVARLNRLIMEEMETEHYFTLLLAVADLKTGNVQMAQAWHPHPLVQRSGGSVDQSGPGGLPVGLIEGANYRQFEISLYPGDRILILSDGVTECPDPAGVLLGEDGLEDAMKRLKDVKGEALLEALIWELTAFSEGKEFPDDVSGILLEFNH